MALYFILRKVLPPTSFQERKDFIELYTKVIGSSVLIISLLFTWLSTENTLKVSTEALKQAQEKARQDEQKELREQQKELAERFIKANEQLASESIYTRTGAVYLLGQIANDSKDYYWRAMQALTDFIRARSSNEGTISTRTKCPEDIQAAMNVIGWRQHKFGAGEDQRLELHGADLRFLFLKDKEKDEGKTREGAHLEGAQLWETNLENANLRGARLEGAILAKANLKNAYLYGAHFSNTTDLSDAILEGVDLGNAEGLTLSVLAVAPDWYKIKSPPHDETIRVEWEKKRKAQGEK